MKQPEAFAQSKISKLRMVITVFVWIYKQLARSDEVRVQGIGIEETRQKESMD